MTAGSATGVGSQGGMVSGKFSWALIRTGLVGVAVAAVAVGFFLFAGDAGKAVGLSILVLGTSAAVGCLAGFLFGVPKSIGDDSAQEDAQYVANSNLEQVSDWLTKILVGVGLVEIRTVADSLGRLGSFLGRIFGDQPGVAGAGSVYALGLLLGGVLTGFILSYMWTRTRFYEVLSMIKGGPSRRTVKTL